MKLIIISNRLPVKFFKKDDNFHFSLSEGGLATGLNSLSLAIDRHWIGWPEAYPSSEEEKKFIIRRLEPYNFHPVFLSSQQVHDYYEGYSNSIIWPLCHYFYSYVQYDNNYWQTYYQVNELFSQVASMYIEPGDIVWVQDYQLMLLPYMLRKVCPDIRIGYFHHIPFPSYELFRVLPERLEILRGLLGADLIGFHIPDYVRHFVSALKHVLNIGFEYGEIRLKDRVVHVDTFPMGINFTKYYEAPLSPIVQKNSEKLKRKFNSHKLILSVDRLDYSKGILHRLKGFELFLEKHPEYWRKISLVMIIVPSRDKVNAYAYLKRKINEAVSNINGKYSDIDWTPVKYFYRSFSFEELIAMYSLAHIALVTPLRDGMNLVAKEYVAAKRNTPGVLILSEMAGASTELEDAIIVNPNDACEIEKAIYQALEMTEHEQIIRLQRLQHFLSLQTVNKWATDFINELELVGEENKVLRKKLLGPENLRNISQIYQRKKKRLILLDYDGTLVPFAVNPEEAIPSQELYVLLKDLTSDPSNTVVISSGRDHITLEKWFGHLPLLLAAEHGAFYKEHGLWHSNLPKEPWDKDILRILRQIINKTPGSKMEIKQTALVWHYRNVNPWLASIREQQLIRYLTPLCSRHHLQLMRGNKILEIKSSVYTKGSEARRLMAKNNYNFVLAMGDDLTDEEMFQVLPPDAVTIKVGRISEYARFNIQSQSEALPFLYELANYKRISAVTTMQVSFTKEKPKVPEKVLS